MWQNLKAKSENFLRGRYGMDILNKYLIGLSFIIVLLGIFIPYISFLGLGILIYSYIRMFSKNVRQRGLENYRFVIFKNKILKPFKTLKLRIFGDKSFKFYQCSNCKQLIRVPRNKGKIEIRCPKCNHHFIKKT